MLLLKICKKAYNILKRKAPYSFLIDYSYKLKIKRGEKLYFSLSRKYKENSINMNICPYKGTGDVYLAAGFFNKSELKKSKYIFCVIGKSNEKVAELFGLNNIEVITKEEMDSLFNFAVFSELKNIHILHPNPPNDSLGFIDMFRNINNLIFTDIIGYGAFNCKKSQIIDKSVFPNFDEKMEKLFESQNLIKGKTILIAPYSYTLRNHPKWFWKKLACELINLGYTVCTNIGNEKEKTIEGTKGIFLKYEELDSFLKMAGYFIGIRSGFCEVISSIPCKKIILYQPYYFWGDSESIDYFSLEKMGLCDDAIELQHTGCDFYTLIEIIVKNIV